MLFRRCGHHVDMETATTGGERRSSVGDTAAAFVRKNLGELVLSEVCAHGGDGEIRFARIAEAAAFAGGCNFVDYAELPPQASIGRHRHADDEEELYLVLEGSGVLWRDGEQLAVRAGDLVRNRPGGEHGLRNTGTAVLRLFVIELRALR
jgi:mannose-6-phosphate isomerase-like protein (cupin superfamily)